MKVKSILGFISAICLMFISCSEEIATDGLGADASIDITLITSGVETKAEPYVTADELKINTCAIAIFKDDRRVGFKYVASSSESEIDQRYKISDIETELGEVCILVVANSDKSEEELGNLSTYEGFKAQSIEHTDDTDFKASSLIKFGEKFVKLTAASKDIEIPLTQVAARVDVTYEMTLTNGWEGKIATSDVAKINRKSSVFLEEYKLNDYTFGDVASGSLSSTVVTSNKFSFYTYEKADAITITVPVVLTLSNKTEERAYTLSLKPTKSETCSTNGFVHGHYYDVIGKMAIDVNLDCTVSWEVKSFEKVTVTIPNFE